MTRNTLPKKEQSFSWIKTCEKNIYFKKHNIKNIYNASLGNNNNLHHYLNSCIFKDKNMVTKKTSILSLFDIFNLILSLFFWVLQKNIVRNNPRNGILKIREISIGKSANCSNLNVRVQVCRDVQDTVCNTVQETKCEQVDRYVFFIHFIFVLFILFFIGLFVVFP